MAELEKPRDIAKAGTVPLPALRADLPRKRGRIRKFAL